LANESHGENINAKLNVLTVQIQQLSQSIRHPLEPHSPISEMTYVEDNFRVMNTVQDCIRSAEKFATDTQSSVAESERLSVLQSPVGSIIESPVVQRPQRSRLSKRTTLEACVHSKEAKRPVATSVGSETDTDAGIIRWIPPPMPPPGDTSTIDPESTDPTEHTLIPDDDGGDLEYSLIQNWREYAALDFKLAEYAQAELRLQKILARSEAKYGDQYHWKEETLALLATAYRHQKKWDLAEEILVNFVDERTREERNQDALDINHELAELYLAKGDLEAAETHGVRAVNGRKRGLGNKHDLFYESVRLIIAIYEAKGDKMEADGYRPLLPPDHLNKEREEIEQLSRMRPQDAAAHIGIDFLKDLLPDECLWKWDEIRTNVMLCRDGIRGSGSGYTLLHAITEFGNEVSLTLLLAKGSDVNAVDHAGNTALHLAAKSRQAIVQMLLDNGAEIDASANDGRTALINAAESCRPDIVRLLIEKGANIKRKDSLDWSALHYAAFEGSATVVQMLLEKGADLEMIGGYGRTPLHCAASRGRETVVQILVQKGANVRAKSRDGLTALDLARKQSHQSIVLYLQCHPQNRRKWTFP
jgi:ankyrin repeat protein